MHYPRHRDEFPEWLNAAGLTGAGAEIGVFTGDFSALLLAKWNGKMLHGIDPFIAYPTEEWRDGANRPDLPDIGKQTAERFKDHPGYALITKPSLEAVKDFGDGHFDFVYLDANHKFEAVRDDLRAWWPKVRCGGIIGLHDFYSRNCDAQLANVAQAVWEFCYEIRVSFTVSCCTTAWIRKP